MLKEERMNFILSELTQKTKVLSTDLSLQLQVSEDTIRRDLKELADIGKIRKVHGGAISMSANPYTFHDREVFALENKITIAKKAAPIIQDGQVLIMDGGTTNLEFARHLPETLRATVVTNSLPVAHLLSDHPKIELIFLGGRVLKNAQVTVGVDVINALDGIRADYCILGTRSLHHEIGITEIDWEETKVKQSMVRNSEALICLVIAEKLGTIQPYLVSDIKTVDILVTELDKSDNLLLPYQKLGIEII
jgi:DeoR family transcriptional regulator, fructose operon transcriptional repressor